ncbi:acetyl-CoA carboxylase, carboxyltransferase subunit beta [bacterium]|nr:acetyl-CoA carboxylase, carboxyltransferase subunit beta [bacterium]
MLFRKPKYATIPLPKKKIETPEGLWIKCDECGELIYKKDWQANQMVCPECNFHSRLGVKERLQLIMDEGVEEFNQEIKSVDFLKFIDSKSYSQRLEDAQKKTGFSDAIITVKGSIHGYKVVAGILCFDFMGGSMGSVMGEKIALAVNKCIKENLPLVIFSASGGARMQEGTMSLMQMAKTSASIAKLSEAGIPYISVLTHPTTGGVTASFATLADIIIAEPKALICFAGPRVIEQTIGQKLPEGFQRSEFLLKHGLLDMVVSRKEMKATLSMILKMLYPCQQYMETNKNLT